MNNKRKKNKIKAISNQKKKKRSTYRFIDMTVANKRI
jgi:hypothetical protein